MKQHLEIIEILLKKQQQQNFKPGGSRAYQAVSYNTGNKPFPRLINVIKTQHKT